MDMRSGAVLAAPAASQLSGRGACGIAGTAVLMAAAGWCKGRFSPPQ